VGERWSLLIVRELLIRPARYGDLLDSLHGVPTNVLAGRLRQLEAHGAVERRYEAGARAVVYALTRWGSELRDAVDALVRWGSPLMRSGRGQDSFRPHWLVTALGALLRGRSSRRAVAIELLSENASFVVRIDRSGVEVTQDTDQEVAATLRAEPSQLFRLAAGLLSLDGVIASGSLSGSRDAVALVFSPQRAQPSGAPA